MIKTTHLNKRYGDIQAVKDVSFDIPKGEICGLLGRNGAGKTTVMKMITGYIEPTEGTVQVDGIDVLEDRLAVQQKIGYMPENAPLYTELPVQEYLQMMYRLRGLPAEKETETIKEAVQATGVQEYLTRPIGTLSKGYRQRVGICQAILHSPDVLILDEPTNGLDPVQIVEIRHLIKALAKKSTVIISTHILQEIEAICDRVLILIDGELAQNAPLSEFLSASAIQLSIAPDTPTDGLDAMIDEIDGLETISPDGTDKTNGFSKYRITWRTETAPIPEIIAYATRNDWKIGSITAHPPSLEDAFGHLMIKHADNKKTEDAA